MWRIDVQKDGQRRSFYSSKPGRTGQREANAKADAWLDDGVEVGRARVSDILDDHLERVKTTSRGNYRKEAYIVETYIRPAIGRKKISDLQMDDLQRILDKAHHHTDKKTGKPVELSRKTLQGIRSTISAMLKICRRRKLLYLVGEDLEIPKSSRVKGKNILQPDGLAVLFSSDATTWRGKPAPDPLINAYRLQVLLGLRPGELKGLTPSDFQGDRLTIRRAVNSYNEETMGKNENAIRAITLSAMARSCLEDQMQRLPDDGTLFGLPSLDAYRARWKEYCATNKIPYVTPYELRHTFVSVVKNLPEGEVKSLVGHSKSMDTFGVYGHAISGEDKKVSIRVNSLFVDLLKEYQKRGKNE